METARFIDGEPANLPAAALDALEWLEWLRKHLAQQHHSATYDELRRRLALATDCLREHLVPCLPETYEHAPSGAVAVVVASSAEPTP
jgi:hypothetical protein